MKGLEMSQMQEYSVFGHSGDEVYKTTYGKEIPIKVIPYVEPKKHKQLPYRFKVQCEDGHMMFKQHHLAVRYAREHGCTVVKE